MINPDIICLFYSLTMDLENVGFEELLCIRNGFSYTFSLGFEDGGLGSAK
jgi:hypothetical protein